MSIHSDLLNPDNTVVKTANATTKTKEQLTQEIKNLKREAGVLTQDFVESIKFASHVLNMGFCNIAVCCENENYVCCKHCLEEKYFHCKDFYCRTHYIFVKKRLNVQNT